MVGNVPTLGMRQRNKPSSSKYKAECDKHQDTAAEQQSLIEEMHFPHDDEEYERDGEELPTFTSAEDEECDQHDGAAEQQPFIEEMRFSHDDEECARHGEELPTFTSVKDEECDQHNGEELLVPTKNEEWEEAREEEQQQTKAERSRSRPNRKNAKT